MTAAFIVDAIRTPMGRGRPGGSLSGVHPADLLGQVLAAVVARNGLDPAVVEDLLVGCVGQVGEQSGNIGRMAWLGAGLPESVPSVTVERKCGSGQQAFDFAVHGVVAGAYDIVIAAGVESMSRVPLGVARGQADPYGQGVAQRYAPGLVGQGVAAELVSAAWHLDRETLDAYAVRSHQRADAVQQDSGFDREVLPVHLSDGTLVSRDETVRGGTSLQVLGQLKPAFYDEEVSSRFPQIAWTTTAGNSSQITDGASAVLIASEAAIATHGLTPRARWRGSTACGDDPLLMLTGPITATRRLLERTGVRLDDVQHVEVNEAFACVPLAWEASLGADPSRVNPRGGAIALGHPLGASGVRLLTTMIHGLEDSGGRLGLQTMCEAGGMANATLIERI